MWHAKVNWIHTLDTNQMKTTGWLVVDLLEDPYQRLVTTTLHTTPHINTGNSRFIGSSSSGSTTTTTNGELPDQGPRRARSHRQVGRWPHSRQPIQCDHLRRRDHNARTNLPPLTGLHLTLMLPPRWQLWSVSFLCRVGFCPPLEKRSSHSSSLKLCSSLNETKMSLSVINLGFALFVKVRLSCFLTRSRWGLVCIAQLLALFLPFKCFELCHHSQTPCI